MAEKNGAVAVAAEVAIGAEQEVQQDQIVALSDPGAKKLGPAKGGGVWYKNRQTGKLYRVDKDGGVYKVTETREPTPAANKKAKKAGGSSARQDLMMEAKSRGIKYHRILSKAELIQVLAKETTPETIAKIQQEAIKRWKGSRTPKAMAK